jgi:hypothetical protein
MRGGYSSAKTKPPIRPNNEATAFSSSNPAPFEGWNARGNLANMKPTEAIQMDNIFPNVQVVELRKGSSTWATAAPATLRSIFSYNGKTAAASKLFVSTTAGIYDVTASSAIGAAVLACAGGNWKTTMISTSGGTFLALVNGADVFKTFDGTAWNSPAITAIANTAVWNYITLHKHRLWFVEKESTDLWYLPTDAIAGAASKFPVGGIFKLGGYIVAIGTWTLDSGQGSDDLFAICTSEGEIAVYQGTDPASANTWALVGVYSAAKPVGTDPFYDYGGDLLYLSQAGLLPLSSLVQSTAIDYSNAISRKIDGAFIDSTTAYGSIVGWQMITHKSANALIVNVPIVQDQFSYQYVMNTATKAWCRFIGWNASAWTSFGGNLYFTSGTTVIKAWDTGSTTDSGTAITGRCYQAYAKLGYGGQKNITLVRPNFGTLGAAQIDLALDADFKTFDGQTSFTYAPPSSTAVWDTSLWGTGVWGGGNLTFDSKWLTVPGMPGYLHSLRVQVTTSSGDFDWTSTDFAMQGAGIL